MWERENESLIKIRSDTQRKNKPKPPKISNPIKNIKSKNSNVSHHFLWIKNQWHPLLKPWRSVPCFALRWSRENPKGERAEFRDGPKHVTFFWETKSLGTIQACNSANLSTPLRTWTRIEVSFFLNDSCKVFWTPPFPFLNTNLDQPEFPIRNSSIMSPV